MTVRSEEREKSGAVVRAICKFALKRGQIASDGEEANTTRRHAARRRVGASEEIKVIAVFLSDRQSQRTVKVPGKMDSSEREL